VRRAYKRLALLYHPDKHKAAGAEERAAVAARFALVTDAFDVLADEESRALYDKVRDHQEASPGGGLPHLTPAEAALLRASGAGELSRLRRAGHKLGKHAPLRRDAAVSLEKLNGGGTKAVEVERRRLDYSGRPFLSKKTFHLVIRRGSREGDEHVYEGEGHEAVDTHAGDLVVMLRQKPHSTLRRRGAKDLEAFAASAAPGDAFAVAEVETVRGRRRAVVVPALAAALMGGGVGGVWRRVLPGEGLYDAAEPWEAPPGDLAVHVRYGAVLLADRPPASPLRLAPVHVVGSAAEAVPAALAGGAVAAALRHRAEAAHMRRDYQGAPPRMMAVCLSVRSGEEDGSGGLGGGGGACTPAAAAVLQVLRCRVPGLRAAAATFMGPRSVSDDAAWCALHEADALVLELHLPAGGGGGREAALAAARRQLEAAGVMHLLWKRAWLGCHIVAVGDACALLGAPTDAGPAPATPPVLPRYALRAGGAPGWGDVHAAAAAAPAGLPCVGVLAGSVCVVDAVSGGAELLVAPPKAALIAAAAWAAAHDAAGEGLREADDEFGFLYACMK
jgi:curved DNA-binding protein CbpA